MIELKTIQEFPQEIIAVDEVGRSPLSGPVVIGAIRLVVETPEALEALVRYLKRLGVKDSKLLKMAGRRKILNSCNIPVDRFRRTGQILVKGLKITFVTWEMDHAVIDQENILRASLRGMKEAALHLAGEDKSRTTLLIDGHMKLHWDTEAPWREVPIVKGDVKSPLIALAAILAKEKRDEYMREMHLIYPAYGFEKNVGYPTKEHRLAIEVHGPCPIHRRTFSRVKEYI